MKKEDWFTLDKTGEGDSVEWSIKWYYGGEMNNACYGFSDYAEALQMAESMTLERRPGVKLYEGFESRPENGLFALYWYDSSGKVFFRDGTWQSYRQMVDFAHSERSYIERQRQKALNPAGEDDIHNTGIDLNGFNPFPSDGDDPNYGADALSRAGIATPDYIPYEWSDGDSDYAPWEGPSQFPTKYETFDEKWERGLAKFLELRNE